MRCQHKDYQIIHRDFGTYVLEFCTANNCNHKRRITGDEMVTLQAILSKGDQRR